MKKLSFLCILLPILGLASTEGKAPLGDLVNEKVVTNAWMEVEDKVTNAISKASSPLYDLINELSLGKDKLIYPTGDGFETKSLLTKEALVVFNDADLVTCKNESITLMRIFNSWGKFDLGPDAARPANWIYDYSNKTICETINTTRLAGFYSPNYYKNYDIVVRLYSSNSDNDTIGLLAACAMDDSGVMHTLSIVRALGDQGTYWSFILDLNNFNHLSDANGQTILVDGTDKVANSKHAWNASGYGIGTVVRLKREGNKFTAWCSEFGTTNILESTEISLDLDTLDNSVASLFKGSAPFGFVTFSQPYSMYELISGFDLDEYIIDAIDEPYKVWRAAGDDWEVTGEDPLELIGGSRLQYNRVTGTLSYCGDDKFIDLGNTTDLRDLIRRTKAVNAPIEYTNGSRRDVRVQIGDGAQATGWSSTYHQAVAIGSDALATGPATVALGPDAEAHGDIAIALGWRTYASGSHSIAIGGGTISHVAATNTVASGANSIAIGTQAKVNGDNSVQLGTGTLNESNSLKFKDVYVVKEGVLQTPPKDPVDIRSSETNAIMVTGMMNTLDLTDAEMSLGLEYTTSRNYEIFIDNTPGNRQLPILFKFHEDSHVNPLKPFDPCVRKLPVMVTMKSPVPNRSLVTIEYMDDPTYTWAVSNLACRVGSSGIDIEGKNLSLINKAELVSAGSVVETIVLDNPFGTNYTMSMAEINIDLDTDVNESNKSNYSVNLYDIDGNSWLDLPIN